MNLLFLQGHPSFFARDLGRLLRARGHDVCHVTLNPGDWLFWPGEGSTAYRGSLARWEDWLDQFVTTRAITHLVYFADRHPYHVAAQRVALRRGIIPVSYEFGYLRPDWITVERGGQSVYSHFPNRLEVIRAAAANLPAPDTRPRFSHPHWQESVAEVAYHLGNALLWPFFPRFVADRVNHPIREYLSYIPRNRRAARNAAPAQAVVRARLEGTAPYFVFALQMSGDYQIRANSRYSGLSLPLQDVITSFAKDAPAGARLVVKLHPMDNGITDWEKVTVELARAAGIADRVDFIDGGDLMALLSRASGCVVINSTVGLHALQAGCPVTCLGIATYDVEGITHQGPLASFWQDPHRPDPADVSALVRLLAAAIQVRGDFFSAEGRAAAVMGAADLIEGGLGAAFGAEDVIPPRIGQARSQGIPVDPAFSG